jgi:8-oxo-dGTP diphosphatase
LNPIDGTGILLSLPGANPMAPEPSPAHRPAHPSPTRRLRVAAAVVWDDGRLLMTRRPPGGPLGLMWEFPGGKIEAGETPEHAVVREIREELGVEGTALEVLAVETHDYAHGLEVEITFVRCSLESLRLIPGHGVHETRWQAPAEVDLAGVLAGDRDFLTRLGARPATTS